MHRREQEQLRRFFRDKQDEEGWTPAQLHQAVALRLKHTGKRMPASTFDQFMHDRPGRSKTVGKLDFVRKHWEDGRIRRPPRRR